MIVMTDFEMKQIDLHQEAVYVDQTAYAQLHPDLRCACETVVDAILNSLACDESGDEAGYRFYQQRAAALLFSPQGMAPETEEDTVLTPDALSNRAEIPPVKKSTQKPLTKSELSILRALSDGSSSKEIANRLCVVKGTVDFHLYNAYAKLGVSNRIQALREAKRLGLLTEL